jgi:hypothetical protein
VKNDGGTVRRYACQISIPRFRFFLRRFALTRYPFGGFANNLNLADFVVLFQILLPQSVHIDVQFFAIGFPLDNRRQFLRIETRLQHVFQTPLESFTKRDFHAVRFAVRVCRFKGFPRFPFRAKTC